jgi:hypothetical protein
MNNKLKMQNSSEIILNQIKVRDSKIVALENDIIVLEEKLKRNKNTIATMIVILIMSLIGNLILIVK